MTHFILVSNCINVSGPKYNQGKRMRVCSRFDAGFRVYYLACGMEWASDSDRSWWDATIGPSHLMERSRTNDSSHHSGSCNTNLLSALDGWAGETEVVDYDTNKSLCRSAM